jgi:hypothetical protein
MLAATCPVAIVPRLHLLHVRELTQWGGLGAGEKKRLDPQFNGPQRPRTCYTSE